MDINHIIKSIPQSVRIEVQLEMIERRAKELRVQSMLLQRKAEEILAQVQKKTPAGGRGNQQRGDCVNYTKINLSGQGVRKCCHF